MADTKTVVYTKVTEDDPSVIALAEASGLTTKEVVAFENSRRYRLAYNRLNQERMKVVRRLVKEHPELLRGK